NVATPAVVAPPPAASPPAAPAAAASEPAQPPPPAGEAACLLGEHDGIAEANARTSTAMVCGALRDAGAQVRTTPLAPAQAYGFTAAYRVALRPLGNLVLLHVSYEAPVGQELRSRRLQLSDIEEMTVAAPRIADALVHDKPLSETANIANLVGEDTRRARKASGESFFALGIFGFTIPDDAWAGYGVLARFHYQTLDYAVSLEGRLGTSTANDGDAHLYGLAVGGRYFFGDGDVAPFLGGGLGVLWVGVEGAAPGLSGSEPNYAYASDPTEREGSGLAPFVEVGIELLRMHDSRLDAALRADLPLYEIGTDDDQAYALPVSLLASYSFD
ncbi:MAG TPA: hypothetical protein VK509_04590, partial [Polyangiales bacterium]|nr:hypothetical protein [Polyangiales bacterium]